MVKHHCFWSVTKEILGDYNPGYIPEDLLCMYMLMEGGAITAGQMLNLVTRPDSPFLSEGKDLLISEFGRGYGTYFSILQLIASGKTTQKEIDSIVGKNTGAYLANLEKEYGLIARNKPMFARPESRNARWSIDDNYVRFWFRWKQEQGLSESSQCIKWNSKHFR